MKSFQRLRLALALTLAFFAAGSAHAAITVLDYWHMGESDTNAISGGYCTNTVDAMAGHTLTNTSVGGLYPSYTNGVSVAASAETGSTLALALTNGQYGTALLATNLTDNFGIECWVKPGTTAPGGQVLAYNGLRGNGWGLYQSGTNFEVLYGGFVNWGSALATAGVWTHLALVRNNGVATLYTNGVPASTNPNTPITPTGSFTVGGDAQYGEYFTGTIDEVRVFTFAPGAFSTNDLLLNSTHLFVSNTNDNGAGSLRDAVAYAPNNAVITFASNLSGQTITLTDGQITLSQNVTIDASAMPGGMTISGNNQSRIFQVNGGANVILNSLTLTAGNDTAGNNGGAIYSDGNLTLSRCTVSGNTSTSYAGGIWTDGQLTLTRCTFSGNTAYEGGAVRVEGGGLIDATNCTFAGNSANVGGALSLYFGAASTFTQVTITGNSAADGFYGGGGIFLWTDLNLINCVVAGNTAPVNADINHNYGGNLTASGNNLIGDNSSISGVFPAGPLAGTSASPLNPQLAPLGNYGGPTQTMPPYAGSPAIDAGSDAAASQFATDQRGYPRLLGAHVDIGAVEVNTNTIVTTAADNGAAGSLRHVIASTTNTDLISFAPNLSGSTITLTNGQIELGNNLTVDGSALPNGIAINGNASSRVFFVDGGVTAALNALTITNASSGYGGGTINIGTLTVKNCTLVNNHGNNFSDGGGAIENWSYATLTVINSTFTGNYVDGGNNDGGGAIVDEGGTMTVINSTFIGNSSGTTGGGIHSYGTLNLTNSIICSNTASVGPNIYASFSGANNLVDTNALLAPLGNYGGPTPTMPPLPGSPAIDAGIVIPGLTTDQRGFLRVVGPFADIGAVESGNAIPGFVPVVTTNSDAIYSIGAGAVSLREAVAFATGNSPITFAPSMSGQTIVLTNGQITLSQADWIDGSRLANGIQISGNHSSRIFNISTNGATLTSLTMINANGGGGDGGALYNAGNTVLNYCTFTGNSTGSGGAIKNAGGSLVLNECTLYGNSTAGGGGGGIVNYATLFLNGCTLTGNSAGFFGGAIYSETGGHVTLDDTIAAGNTANDIYNNGTLTLSASNIVQSISGSSSGTTPINASPQLAALGNYGGPTPTMPPLPGSPAIDAGDDSETNFLQNDQRNYPRLAGAHVDIGAVEGVYDAGPGKIKNITHLGNGSVQLSFTNVTDAVFPVLATTNLTLSLGNWTRIGFATESPVGSGQFPFTDTQATNYPQRYYLIRSP